MSYSISVDQCDESMALIQDIFRRIGFLSPVTKFKAGDHVRLLEGGPLMTVEWVKASPEFKTHIICCKWIDPVTQQTQTHIFTDDQVRLDAGRLILDAGS